MKIKTYLVDLYTLIVHVVLYDRIHMIAFEQLWASYDRSTIYIKKDKKIIIQ